MRKYIYIYVCLNLEFNKTKNYLTKIFVQNNYIIMSVYYFSIFFFDDFINKIIISIFENLIDLFYSFTQKNSTNLNRENIHGH